MDKTNALDPKIRQKVAASFGKQGMMQSFDARLTDLDIGSCEITAPIKPETSQQHGFAHAGLTFALGDSAAGYAALAMMPWEAEVLTVEMKINLLAPAKGATLIARGQVIKPGRRLIIVRADVFARDGGGERHVALLQGTMIPV